MTNEEIRIMVLKQIEEKLRVGDHTISINELDFTEFNKHVSVSNLKSARSGFAQEWENREDGHASYWKNKGRGSANNWENGENGFNDGWEVKGRMYPTMKKYNQVEKKDVFGQTYYETIKTYSFDNMTKEEILKELGVKNV